MLHDFTETLRLSPEEEGAPPLEVRVPTLGAFVLNKANTFSLRRRRDEEIKAAKDLIYLRDIMAAGERLQERLSADLRTMIDPPREQAKRVTRLIVRGGYHLRNVAPKLHGDAAEILAERAGIFAVDAEAEVGGHVRDLAELFQEVIDASVGLE